MSDDPALPVCYSCGAFHERTSGMWRFRFRGQPACSVHCLVILVLGGGLK